MFAEIRKWANYGTSVPANVERRVPATRGACAHDCDQVEERKPLCVGPGRVRTSASRGMPPWPDNQRIVGPLVHFVPY